LKNSHQAFVLESPFVGGSAATPLQGLFSRTVPVLSLRDERSSRSVTDNRRRRLYSGCDDL